MGVGTTIVFLQQNADDGKQQNNGVRQTDIHGLP